MQTVSYMGKMILNDFDIERIQRLSHVSIEQAVDDTIFLDEIGELPLELQSRLLRVLQEGEFERPGNSDTIKVDVRINFSSFMTITYKNLFNIDNELSIGCR